MHVNEFHDQCSSPNAVRTSQSGRINWQGLRNAWKRREECTQGLWENLKQVDHLEGLDIKGIIMPKLNLNEQNRIV